MTFEAYQLSIISQNWGDDHNDFFVQAHCEVRQKGSVGGEAFELNIVSPKALVNELKSDSFKYEYGQGYFFTNQYDESKVLSKIQKLIDGFQATSWEELIEKTSKYFTWVD